MPVGPAINHGLSLADDGKALRQANEMGEAIALRRGDDADLRACFVENQQASGSGKTERDDQAGAGITHGAAETGNADRRAAPTDRLPAFVDREGQ